MSILKNLFGKKDEPIKSYDDFWNWFKKHEKDFYKAVKQNSNIEKNFFNKLSPKLAELKEGFFYLTGMTNDTTAELALTADGAIKNIVFVEELIRSAPTIDGWKFTALKPALDIKDVTIEMEGYQFSDKNISFYPNEHPNYPDEIDITIVHFDLDKSNKETVVNGTYIFLDNYLGELDFATTIDNLSIVGKEKIEKELIPIEKLKAYLTWRQKEFVEKYEGVRHNTEHDNYSTLEATLENGNLILAVVNTDLLAWDRKASHPWILKIEISYDGDSSNGMPDAQTYELLDTLESQVLEQLKDSDGYLSIGRQTAESTREIYFACSDFRKPSKVMNKIEKQYASQLNISYDIYKDKYWQSFDRFIE